MIRPQSSKSFSSLVLRPSHNHFHSLYWWINFINIFWCAKSAAKIHKSSGHPSKNPWNPWHWMTLDLLRLPQMHLDWLWRNGFHSTNAPSHQLSIEFWRYCIIFRFVLYCWHGIKNQLSNNTEEVQSNGKFNPIPGHENREGRRRNLRSTADLYSDPLPNRQNQVCCGRSPLAREYEQLGPVFWARRPHPGGTGWSCGWHPPGGEVSEWL